MENFRAFRGLSGTYNVRANEGVSDPAQNIECIVHFLNDTRQKFIIDRRCKGQALLDSVFKHLNLIETDFFGLKFTPNEQNRLPKATSQNSQGVETNVPQLDKSSPSPPLTSPPESSSSSLSASSRNSAARQLGGSPDSRNPLKLSPTNGSNVANGSINKNFPGHCNSPLSILSAKDNSSPTRAPVSSQEQIDFVDNSASSTLTSLDKALLLPDQLSKSVTERWLDPTKGIKKQCKSGPPYNFYFRVKFYVSDPCKLADDSTRYHLYQQLKLDIYENRLIVPTCSAILLASYILQSEVGDYRLDSQVENDNVSKYRLLPNQRDDFNKKVIELHKQHKFLSPADAQHQFLEHAAKKLDCYGVEFHHAHDIQTRTDVQVGVSSNGIIVSRENLTSSSMALDTKGASQLYSWAKILKIMFKKKIFSIQLRRDDHQRNSIIASIGGTSSSIGTFIEFSLLTNQACKSFWEECVAQHSFFRLHQPKSQPKKFFSFLKFGSKFQYNGKTEYQTMEESKKRSFSHFSRSLSKRYARNTIPIGRPSSNSTGQDDGSKTNVIDSLAESIAIIKKGLETKKLIRDFEKLSRKKEDETLEESRLMENIDKNRYQDILPYDSTRVQLIDSMTGDYINASFVDMPVPSGRVNRYIATQGPLSSTCDDFWQMVWEQNCSLIIMVTPLVEAGRIKCHKYWPDEKDEVRHGQILVRNLSEKSKTATIDRSLQLVDVKSGETRMATQIQYKAWPDHEVPEDCGDFLKLVNRVRKHRAACQDDPIVVHCSAGIGRTGVLILMETALCTMECGEPIFPTKILSEMRKQRAMLIQTNSQFQFVADAITKVFDQKSYRKFCKLKKK